MKPFATLAAALYVLASHPVYGLATSRVGPDSNHKRPTTEQSDWPKGIVALPRHESRVYSVWVNGSENFYFKAKLEDVNEMIRLFSKTRMRDHEVHVKKGSPKTRTFDKDQYAFNVNLHILAGIALGYRRDQEAEKTHEPKLTIHVSESETVEWLDKLVFPENIILTTEFDQLKSPRQRPDRKLRFAEIRFENGKPAADFANGVQTRLAWWDKGNELEIQLGDVSYKGKFHAAFSAEEIGRLTSGESWITMTTGNWSTAKSADHTRLPLTHLFADRSDVKAMTINAPGYHHGRILFEDGSPPVLDPKPLHDR